MNERNLNEGQWEDRKRWSLGVGQRRKTFWNRYMHIYNLTNSVSNLLSILILKQWIFKAHIWAPCKA
jgi:hypothetical protein